MCVKGRGLAADLDVGWKIHAREGEGKDGQEIGGRCARRDADVGRQTDKQVDVYTVCDPHIPLSTYR